MRTYPGRVTAQAVFLWPLPADLEGTRLVGAGVDRLRRGRGVGFVRGKRAQTGRLSGEGRKPRTCGDSAGREGSEHLPGRGAILADAVRASDLRHDVNGEPAIDKHRSGTAWGANDAHVRVALLAAV